MKKNQWAKTLIYTYKYLDRIAEAIDKLVDRNALNSFYFSSNNQKRNGVLTVSDRIIELIERKKRIINIKVLTEQALSECDAVSGQILVQKFIDDDNAEEIAKRMKVSVRTYFRKQEGAESAFYANLAKRGFDEKKLENYLRDEKWILEVYNRFVREYQEKENASHKLEMVD